ncbi:hypothetical protein GCM10027451_33460 [Geodermatophilus aquaeductus]|uniref:Uncharacterized protein n=1 Tax=Geodermatophilus aquaeductus TaxID=1564161 RepID=A0A521EYY7_9ACTN|nr:hypothetical protein [Geodermatophilus aquaeductus]SMO88380.1 hypothetical protein SAMN06273567_10699 [Geodermatophilus aquaeductus]
MTTGGTTTRTSTDPAGTPAVPPPRRPQERLEHVEALRRAATHLATAQFLEGRADRSDNPVLAALLRDRARERRRRAERILVRLGVRPVRRGPPGQRC